MRNGSFLRMKTAELGYNIKETTLKKFHISGIRIYANGTNLFLISSFKLWDPEQGVTDLVTRFKKYLTWG
jgi:hypothetical protein